MCTLSSRVKELKRKVRSERWERKKVKKAAILQSNYLPWKGYFDIIHDVDVFVILDDVQYTKDDWRNRNRLKSKQGPTWVTVPVLTQGRTGQKICEAEINNKVKWQKKHHTAIKNLYGKSPHFEFCQQLLREVYDERDWTLLSELNIFLIKRICSLLNIETELVDSRELTISIDERDPGRRTDRVIQICRSVGASHYLSGPAARDYIEAEKFTESGIALSYKDYSGYPEYPQRYGDFEHYLSVVDLLCNCGPRSADYIWGRHVACNLTAESENKASGF